MHDYNKIEKAIRFLTNRMPNANELIKPTLFHCMRVGVMLYETSCSDEIIIAGLLHDILEDTETTTDELTEFFGSIVTETVLANTKDEMISGHKTNEDMLAACIAHGESACTVKAADILDNFKFYHRENNFQGIEYCQSNREYFLENLPDNISNVMIEALKEYKSHK